MENKLRATIHSNVLDHIVATVAVAGALYHVAATQFLFYSSIEHQNTHLAFSLILVFLVSLKGKNRHPFVSGFLVILILLSIAATGYVEIFYDDLWVRAGFPSIMDMIVGWILVVLALEACRESYGWILPSLAVAGIVYFIFGQHLPGVFGHAGTSLPRIISFLCIGLSGIYGTILHVSALYIILFLLFGGLLRASGAENFFIEIGKIAGTRLAGGPALVAVISSCLVGTVTGAPAANVAITGTFTIPTMKKAGMKGEEAGAIEAVASTGGVFMPPVMGGTAFLVAAFANVTYATVCKMAIIPALLYYWSHTLYCQIKGLTRPTHYEAEVNVEELKVGLPAFVIPVGLLVYLLVKGYSAQYAIAWTMAALVIIALLRERTRGTPGRWVKGITGSMIAASHVGAGSACIGLLVATIQTTGLGIKLPEMVEVVSGGSVTFTLILTAIATIILGFGLPGPAAYVIGAIVCVPVLLKIGFARPIAHFFVFFFAALAAITPPVGMASLVASKIANAKYLPTGLEGTKAVAIAWLLPFFFVLCPALIMTPWDGQSGIPALFCIVVAQPFFTAFILNHLFLPFSLPERILSLFGALSLWGFIFLQNYSMFAVGLAVTVLVVSLQWIRYRRVPSSGKEIGK